MCFCLTRPMHYYFFNILFVFKNQMQFFQLKKFFFLCNVVLISAIHQRKSAIIIHTSPPSPLPSGSSQSTRLGFLCYTETSHQLPILHPINSVNMLMLLSPFISLSPSPTVSTSPFSTFAFPFLPFPSNRFISIIFLDSVCIKCSFFLWPPGMWYLSSPTRDQTCDPCLGSTES